MPFDYKGKEVRLIQEGEKVWFVAKDVCDVLEIVWKGNDTLQQIQEDWKLLRSYRTSFGEKDTIFINEAAVYKLAFRSNKPEFCIMKTYVITFRDNNVVELTANDSQLFNYSPNCIVGFYDGKEVACLTECKLYMPLDVISSVSCSENANLPK